MINVLNGFNAAGLSRFRALFTPRDVILHDGAALRRFTVGVRGQAGALLLLAAMLCFAAYGLLQAGAAVAGTDVPVSDAKVAQMQARLDRMTAEAAAVTSAAKAQVSRVEQRQALIAAVLAGKKTPDQVALEMARSDRALAALSPDLRTPLRRVEQRQAAFAAKAETVAERRYAMTARELRKRGLNPKRFAAASGGMGGPFEPASAAAVTPEARADAQFRSLFLTWKKLDSLEQNVIAIPSIHPISAELRFSSYFGVRSDPFRGSAAMHAGVDLPGPVGTPIYATADGIVERAGHAGGYGNLVELDHGKGIETRYGHLSKILVEPNQRVKRGQLIALMGSTGRSTGSHLHYEVRIDGRAVNPMPFLQTADYLVALQDKAVLEPAVMTTGVESED